MALDRNMLGWLKRGCLLVLACFCLLLVSTQQASAQVDEGSISGTVTDGTGAVVANASVSVVNTDVGLTLTGTTNSNG